MRDKIVFITGAASGIGLDMCHCLGQKGAKIVMTDLDEKKIHSVAARLKCDGLNVSSLCCDVTDEAQLKGAIDYTHKLHGRLDVLINNAGLQYISPLEEYPTEKFELLLKVMLIGPFIAIKHVFPIMKAQRYGRVINMASINGLVGFAGKAAYNSAKHGLIGLTKVAALESAEFGITVNAICPGYVDTPLVTNQLCAIAKQRNIPTEKVLEEVIYPLVPQKRLITTKEISDCVNYIASDAAMGITGQSIVIDGGFTAQ